MTGTLIEQMPQYADNPQLWRQRAEEARVQAEQMHNEEARRACLMIAESYEKMAVRAEERLARSCGIKAILASRFPSP